MKDTTVIKTEKFNTNNDWGFGGSYGKYYYLANGLIKKMGTACYRHMAGTKYTNWYIMEDNSMRTVFGNVLKHSKLFQVQFNDSKLFNGYVSADTEEEILLTYNRDAIVINSVKAIVLFLEY